MWCLTACLSSANAMHAFTVHNDFAMWLALLGAVSASLVASL